MTTKAVFFDWFHTLARFEPPREEVQSQAYAALGIEVAAAGLVRGLLDADRDWFEENNRLSAEKRTLAEQIELSLRYQSIALAAAGVTVAREQHLKALKKIQERYRGMTFVLYDDVLPALKVLKGRYVIGMLTNANKDLVTSSRLGLEPYLDMVVTSAEAGANKPEPPMFLKALEKARVKPAEAVHVGDQYDLDVVGARSVGINPVLIDRFGLCTGVADCPVIRTLSELESHL